MDFCGNDCFCLVWHCSQNLKNLYFRWELECRSEWEWRRVGGIRVFHYKDSKSVSLWHSAVQLGVYFKFILSFDNPTVTTSDYVELIYAWPENVRPLSLSLQLSASLTLCHDSYVPLYAQTQTDSWLHDFWLRCESASAHATSVVVWAQQVLAIFLPLSSVLCVAVLECTVAESVAKKQQTKKTPENIWTVCLFLSQMITATYRLWLISVVSDLYMEVWYIVPSSYSEQHTAHHIVQFNMTVMLFTEQLWGNVHTKRTQKHREMQQNYLYCRE